MGGIVKSLFGGSSQKSTNQSSQESGNYFKDDIKNQFAPVAQYATSGSNALAALLGLTGGGEQAAAQANFQNTPGYQFAREQGLSGISQAGFSHGTGNSGATLKALDKYGTGLADQTYNNYLDKLKGLTDTGLQAGSLIGQAGQYSKGTSTGTSSGSSDSGGLGKAIGFGLSLLSDRRLKHNIYKIGEKNGMNMHSFQYRGQTKRYEGLIAQEVQEKYPQAVGNFMGYLTVDYSLIPNWS